MQINSSWLPELKKLGIERMTCTTPALILRQGHGYFSNNAKNYGWSWEAIGAYNVGCKSAKNNVRLAVINIRGTYGFKYCKTNSEHP